MMSSGVIAPGRRRTTLIVAVGLCTALALIGLVGLSTYRFAEEERRGAEEIVRARAERAVEALGAQMTRALEEAQIALSAVRAFMERTGRPDQIAAEEAARFLRGFDLRVTPVDSVSLIDGDGREVATSLNERSTRMDLTDRAYFRAHVTNPVRAPLVGVLSSHHAHGGPFVPVSARLEDAEGRFAGVALAALDAARIQQMFATLVPEPGDLIGVLTRDGTPLAAYPEAPSDATIHGYRHFIERLRDRPAGDSAMEAFPDNVDRLVAWRTIQPYGFLVVVAVSAGRVLDGAAREIGAVLRDFLIFTLLTLAATTTIVAMVLRDRRVARALTLSEQRFRDFADASADWLWEMDDQLRFTFFSYAPAADSRFDPREALGRTRRELMGGGDLPEAWARHLDDLDRHLPFRDFTYGGRVRDGSAHHFKISGKPVFDPDGRFLGYRGVGANITRLVEAERSRHELQDQLAQSQRLEALGTLAGGIAHDLNNAMVPILALTQANLRRLPEGSQERRNSERVVEAARRARDLVARILSFSRSSKSELVTADLNEALRETLGILVAVTPATIELRHELAAAPATVRASATDLGQTLMNLMTNAIHAIGPRPGRITVRTTIDPVTDRLAALGASADLRYVRLRVEDDGPGIPAEVIDRVFEPYFTTKPVGEGTGLGLSMVHAIVRAAGGVVELRSRNGSTRFDLYFPLDPARASD